jgi:hypothetical protein
MESHHDGTRDRQCLTHLCLIVRRHEHNHPTAIGRRDLLAYTNNR